MNLTCSYSEFIYGHEIQWSTLEKTLKDLSELSSHTTSSL